MTAFYTIVLSLYKAKPSETGEENDGIWSAFDNWKPFKVQSGSISQAEIKAWSNG
jgi:hypothetical protein